MKRHRQRPSILAPLVLVFPLLGGCAANGESDEELGQVRLGAFAAPTSISDGTTDIEDSELGNMESEEHQGLAACPKYWMWTTVGKIYRVPRGSAAIYEPVTHEVGIPEPFNSMGYDHFGDGECASGHYFAALIDRDKVGEDALVLEYTEDLELVAFGRLSKGEFVGINPADGMIYSQGGEGNRILRAYSRSMMRRFHYDASLGRAHFEANQFEAAKLELLREIELVPRAGDDAWWRTLVVQGGAFSSNGVYYMTIDHPTDEDSAWTGARMFDVTAFSAADAPELDVPGIGSNGILPVSYDPDYLGSRDDELEGITVYFNPGEDFHRVKITKLTNELEDDDVTAYRFNSHEPPRLAVNDHWYREPALW